MDINWNCNKCGKDCNQDPKDYYMLNTGLWLEINGTHEGMICVDCVESYLGRKLLPEDLMDCALNKMGNYYTKEILKNEPTKINNSHPFWEMFKYKYEDED